MNCVLFTIMDQVFILKDIRNTEKVGEFCQSGKVGTTVHMMGLVPITDIVHTMNVVCTTDTCHQRFCSTH